MEKEKMVPIDEQDLPINEIFLFRQFLLCLLPNQELSLIYEKNHSYILESNFNKRYKIKLPHQLPGEINDNVRDFIEKITESEDIHFINMEIKDSDKEEDINIAIVLVMDDDMNSQYGYLVYEEIES